MDFTYEQQHPTGAVYACRWLDGQLIGVYGPTASDERTAAQLPLFEYGTRDVAWLSRAKTFRYDPLPADWDANEREFRRMIGKE